MSALLKLFLDALFGAVITGLRTWQADQNLKALGYTEAQRDVATSQIKAMDAASAARAAVRDDPVSVQSDPDNRARRI